MGPMQPDRGGSPASAAPAAPALTVPPPVAQHQVSYGETVQSVAVSHRVSVPRLLEANPQIANHAALLVGERLNIPAPDGAPEMPATSRERQPQTRVGRALVDLEAAQDRQQVAERAIRNSNRAELADRGEMRADVARAERELKAALAAEIGVGVSAGVSAAPSAAEIRARGGAISSAYAASPADKALLNAQVEGLAQDQEVKDTVGLVLGAENPQDAGRLLAAELPKLAAPVQQRVLTELSRWAAEPLKGVDPARLENQAAVDSANLRADAFIDRLSALTSGLTPAQAQALTAQVMPEIRTASDERLRVYNGAAAPGARFETLSRVVQSLGSGPEAKALTREIAEAYADQLVTHPGSGLVVETAVARGGGPALAMEIAAVARGRGVGARVYDPIVTGVESGLLALRRAADGDMESLGEHLLVTQRAVAVGEGLPGAAEAANGYLEGKGPDFASNTQRLEVAAGGSGKAYLDALAGLAGADLSVDSDGSLLRAVSEALGDAKTQGAIMIALDQHPDLTDDAKPLVEFMGGLKTTKEATEFTRMFTSALIGARQGQAFEIAARGGADNVAKARGMLAEFADEKWASAFGVSPEVYRQTTAAFDEMLAKADSPEAVRELVLRTESALGREVQAGGEGTRGGNFLRGANVLAAATLGFNSLEELRDKQDFANWAGALGDGFGFLKDGADGLGSLMSSQGAGEVALKSMKALTWVFGSLSVGADAAKLFDNLFVHQDPEMAAANALTLAGSGSMLAAMAVTGPPGIVLTAAGVLLTFAGELMKGRAEREKDYKELNDNTNDYLSRLPVSDAVKSQLAQRIGREGELTLMSVLTPFLERQGYTTPQSRAAWLEHVAKYGMLDNVVDGLQGAYGNRGVTPFDESQVDYAVRSATRGLTGYPPPDQPPGGR